MLGRGIRGKGGQSRVQGSWVELRPSEAWEGPQGSVFLGNPCIQQLPLKLETAFTLKPQVPPKIPPRAPKHAL